MKTQDDIKILLAQLDLVKDEFKPVSFKVFKETADAHLYTSVGRPRTKAYIVFAGTPKLNLFGFYPPKNYTKPQALKFAYETYVELLTDPKAMEQFDPEYRKLIIPSVFWGNSGYPLQYAYIYER